MKNINVGYVAGFHGLKGEMKVKNTTDFSEARFKKGSELFLKKDNHEISVIISSSRIHKNQYLITCENYNSLTQVEGFKGYSIIIKEDMLETLEEDEFYFFDLIGLSVYDFLGNNLGKVKSVMETGANEVIVVATDDKDILIPFVKSIVTKVDIEAKRIDLAEIDGLF